MSSCPSRVEIRLSAPSPEASSPQEVACAVFREHARPVVNPRRSGARKERYRVPVGSPPSADLFFSRAFRGAAPRTVLPRRGARRESMFERGHRRCPSELRFAAPTRGRAVSRSASSPAAFSVPFLAGQKGDIRQAIPGGSLQQGRRSHTYFSTSHSIVSRQKGHHAAVPLALLQNRDINRRTRLNQLRNPQSRTSLQ